MPLVPEKLKSRQEVRNAIAAQFWDQPVLSAQSLDGTARTLPCEPPPVGQTADSGLIRAQELLVTQAAGLSLMPSYSSLDGGLVLDRVVMRVGKRNWWTTVTGRARAQQMWHGYQAGTGATVRSTLKDPNNYGVGCRSKMACGRNASLNYVFEAPNVANLRHSLQRKLGKASNESGKEHSRAPYKAEAWAKYHLPGHDLVGTAAWNQQYVDSTTSYCTVPMTVSCDLASKDRPDGIQYRVGMHQVSAPEVEGSSGSLHTFESGRVNAHWRSSLHIQGAVAVEGEGHIWRPGRRHANAAAADATPSAASGPVEKGVPLPTIGMHDDRPEPLAEAEQTGSLQEQANAVTQPSAEGAQLAASPPPSLMQQPSGSSAASANDSQSAASAQQRSQPARQPRSDHATAEEQAPGNPADPTAATAAQDVGTESGRAAEQAVRQAGRGQKQLDRSRVAQGTTSQGSGQARDGLQGGGSRGTVRKPRQAWPSAHQTKGSQTGSPLVDHYSSVISDSEDSDAEAPQRPASLLGNVDASDIQSNIREAQGNIERLRQVLSVVTAGVQESKAQQTQQQQLALAQKHKRKPYSPWLAQPFLKVNAAVGCLARMPLPRDAFQRLERRPAGFHPDADLNRASSIFSKKRWEPYLHDTTLRPFGSIGLTGQLGRFSRPLLDFTSGSVRLDICLTCPHSVPSPQLAPVTSYGNLSVFNPRQDHLDPGEEDDSSPPRLSTMRFKNRAFALEGRGMWHALSVSLTQQIIGPLRFKGDLRYALDVDFSQSAPGKSQLQQYAEAVLRIRPKLLETTVGLDYIIPGSSGIARAAVWYSPKRREGMAEIKLF